VSSTVNLKKSQFYWFFKYKKLQKKHYECDIHKYSTLSADIQHE